MEKVETPLSYVFVGHEYAEHVGREWRESYCFRYPTCPIHENRDLADYTAFAYGKSIHIGSKADALSGKKVGGSGEAGIDVENV